MNYKLLEKINFNLDENKKNVIVKISIVIFFIILLIIGLKFLPFVNGNFDENTEQNILLSNIKDYSEYFSINEVTDFIHNKQILAISLDPNRDHGIAAYYLIAPMLILKQSMPHLVSSIWHFYTYMIWFVGVIFFYKLIDYLYKNKKISVMLTLLYFSTPRMFIDSMHNNKDIVMMSLLVPMIYFGIKFIKDRKLKDGVIYAIFGAFVSNVKILGIFFAGIVGLSYLVVFLIDKNKKISDFIKGIIVAALLLSLYIALTPAIWGNGFNLIEYVNYCLNNAVNFSANPAVLFEGIIHIHTENPLPWYYIPKLIIITLPIIIIPLFLGSIVLLIINTINIIRKKSVEKSFWYMIIVMIMFLVPFGMAIFSNPSIYNGWRHFYFLYAFIMIVLSYCVYIIFNTKYGKYIISSLLVLTIVTNFISIYRYGIANTAYYNILAGNSDLSSKYELDYYNVTSRAALYKFLETDKFEENDDGLIYLYASGFGEVVINDMKTYIDSALNKRIVVLNNDNFEEYLKQGKIVYNMSNPIYRYNDVSKYELVYSYKFKNSEVLNFYKTKLNIFEESEAEKNESKE